MQERLYGEASACTSVSVFLHGDGLNWHCRQWSIVLDTICAVVLTLALADVITASPPDEPCILPVLFEVQYTVISQYCVLDSLWMNAHNIQPY